MLPVYFYTVTNPWSTFYTSVQIVMMKHEACQHLPPAARCVVIFIETFHHLLGTFGIVPQNAEWHKTIRLSVDRKLESKLFGAALVMWDTIPYQIIQVTQVSCSRPFTGDPSV